MQGQSRFLNSFCSVRIHESWIVIFLLITWSFRRNALPYYFPVIPQETSMWWGFAGASILLVSMILHETGHILADSRLGIPDGKRILLPFGAVKDETRIIPVEKSIFSALAGPLASVITASLCYGLLLTGLHLNWSGALIFILDKAATLNIIIAGLNLFPASPLDGSAILKSVCLISGKSCRTASKAAFFAGHTLAILLIAAGAVIIYKGLLISGIWWILTGALLREGIYLSGSFFSLKKSMEGESVSQYMRSNPVTVPPQISLHQFITEYIYRYNLEIFPVLFPGILKCITTEKIREIPREEWERYTVSNFAETCDDTNSVETSSDVMRAIDLMCKNSTGRLIVTENGELAGVITLKDLLPFFSLKISLIQSDAKGNQEQKDRSSVEKISAADPVPKQPAGFTPV